MRKITSILICLAFLFEGMAAFGMEELEIRSFTLRTDDGDTVFDASDRGENERLEVSYEADGDVDSAELRILRSGDLVHSLSFNGRSVSWDGEIGNDRILVEDSYVAELVLKSGDIEKREEEDFTVRYRSDEAPGVNSVSVDDRSFDAERGSVTLSFTSVEDGILEVRVYDSSDRLVRSFEDYEGRDSDDYLDNTNHDIVWNGEGNGGRAVPAGDYSFVITARNDYGASDSRVFVEVEDSDEVRSSSNAHIRGFSCSPGSEFEPAEDDELECEFDVREDDMDIEIFATKSGERDILLYEEDNLDEVNNEEFYWDGTDDGDYVEEGRWIIEIHSRVDGERLIAEKEIEVKYDRPRIDDLFLSKQKIDPELDEFSYLLFRANNDGLLDWSYYFEGDEDEEALEEYRFEDDLWYAFLVDGDNYGYDDDLDIVAEVYNEANENVRDSDREGLRLSEEDEDRKANISNDYISPVLTECVNGDELELSYTLSNDVDRVIAELKKGPNGTGSTVLEIFDLDDQDAGDYSVTFDCEDKNGRRLSDGVYSYKVAASDGRVDNEVGAFVVGDVGEIEGDSYRRGSRFDRDDRDDEFVNGLRINGVLADSYGYNKKDLCGGFFDLDKNSEFCDAVLWAENSGILDGYSDNTVRVYEPINRVEMLKLALEAGGYDESGVGFLSFVDVNNNAWYAGYLRKGLSLGLVRGDDFSNTFRPGDGVNRAEALKIALELARKRGYQLKGGQGYFDIERRDWFYGYAVSAREDRILEVGNYLAPSTMISRGEVLEMLYRLHLIGEL